jgi:hypothetical protein
MSILISLLTIEERNTQAKYNSLPYPTIRITTRPEDLMYLYTLVCSYHYSENFELSNNN